jgi:hypothetical protein
MKSKEVSNMLKGTAPLFAVIGLISVLPSAPTLAASTRVVSCPHVEE